MQWNNIYTKKWVKKFAFLPLDIDGTTVWLQFYWQRFIEIIPSVSCPCEKNKRQYMGKMERSVTQPMGEV